MATLYHPTREVNITIRMGNHPGSERTFRAKPMERFEVPDGYYVKYFIKTVGCVLVTEQSKAPTQVLVKPAATAAPEPVKAEAAPPAKAEPAPVQKAAEKPTEVKVEAKQEPKPDMKQEPKYRKG